jgi:hypothetical protein
MHPSNEDFLILVLQTVWLLDSLTEQRGLDVEQGPL